MSLLTNLFRFAALLFGCAAALPAFAADRPAILPDTMEQRLVACTACHAKDQGQHAFFPRISGKPAGYLYNQLINFRDGRRQYPLMTYMVDHLPDAYLREIADYFSTQHLKPPPMQPSNVSHAVLERGKQLVTLGDKTIKVPACIACHGEKLTGVAPAIPGLAGLPRDYINAQFGAWKNHTRRANAPDCMAIIANRLSLDDVAAISHWLGARALPADPAPATSIARPLPLACGSAPD
ncbi:MAG: c-type cytochrome [Massilia sp.]|nr:c-type cytochrome [Massilia sp.]